MKMVNLVKSKLKLLIAFGYLFLPKLLIAEGTDFSGDRGGDGLRSPIIYTDINSLLTAILDLVIRLGGIVIAIAIIYSGFKFVEARGNKTKIQSARDNLLYVVIGAFIILGAVVLKEVISETVSSIQSAV